MRKHLFAFNVALLLPFAAVACRSDVVSESESDISEPGFQNGIATVMQDPCDEYPQPAGDCDGIFVPRAASDWGNCISGFDQDYDGVGDNCELLVAQAFAPELWLSSQEYYGSRESYWAVKRAELSGRLDIMYMLGYHQDEFHDGDSEFVLLTIEFDSEATTGGTYGRWKVTSAYYSAHYESQGWEENLYGHPLLRYSSQSHPRGVPRVFVSEGKHANYNTRSNCNDGGLFDFDDCSFNNAPSGRIDVLPDRNVGSRNHQFLNCVNSVDTASNYGLECFWYDNYAFKGWQEPNDQSHVQSYGDIMGDFGW